MANVNIFDFLHSNEVDYIASDGGYAMMYHGMHQSGRMYKAGSVVKVVTAGVSSSYVATRHTSGDPILLSGWDIFGEGAIAPERQVVSGDGFNIVSADSFNIKSY